jgi:predicted Zn-dependent protease with MMP-like domain
VGANDRAVFEAALDAFEAALDDAALDEAASVLVRLRSLAAPEDEVDLLYAEAQLVSERDGLQAAVELLRRVVTLDDEHADAHHGLGVAAHEREDQAQMVEHFLRVRALDAKHDSAAQLGSAADVDRIEKVATRVVAELPEPFAEKLAHVPIVLERRPSRELVVDGFDPRSLGLFDGPIHGDHDTPAPTRIVLYTCNLLAEFADGPELDEEVEVTILHEIGHYFGLDEADMVRLGLD